MALRDRKMYSIITILFSRPRPLDARTLDANMNKKFTKCEIERMARVLAQHEVKFSFVFSVFYFHCFDKTSGLLGNQE